MSLLNAGARFEPGASVGLALMCADSGWRADPLVTSTADVIGTHVTVMCSGAVSFKIADDLLSEASGFLGDKFAWDKVKNPLLLLVCPCTE